MVVRWVKLELEALPWHGILWSVKESKLVFLDHT